MGLKGASSNSRPLHEREKTTQDAHRIPIIIVTWGKGNNVNPLLTALIWKVRVGPRGSRHTFRLMYCSVLDTMMKCVTPRGPATWTKSFNTFLCRTYHIQLIIAIMCTSRVGREKINFRNCVDSMNRSTLSLEAV